MGSRYELGVSQQEYEDAINLEKVYRLIGRRIRCENCDRKNPTHVDLNRYEFLCPGCATGKGNCKQIGADRLKSADVRKLERKYKKSVPVKSTIRAPRRDRGENYRSRRIKSPSPSPSVASSSDVGYASEEEEEEVRPVSHRESRRAKSRGGVRSVSYSTVGHSRDALASAAFNDGLAEGGMGTMYDESLHQEVARSVPGMRGVLIADALQQQQQVLPSYGTSYVNQPASGGLQTPYPQTLGMIQHQQRTMQAQPALAFGDNVDTVSRFPVSTGTSSPMAQYQTPIFATSRPVSTPTWPMPSSNINARPSPFGVPFNQLSSPMYPSTTYPSPAVDARPYTQVNQLRPRGLSYTPAATNPMQYAAQQQSQLYPQTPSFPQMPSQLHAAYTPSLGRQQSLYSIPTRVPPISSNPFATFFSPTSAFPG